MDVVDRRPPGQTRFAICISVVTGQILAVGRGRRRYQDTAYLVGRRRPMVVSWTFYLVIDGLRGLLVGARMCNVCLSVNLV